MRGSRPVLVLFAAFLLCPQGAWAANAAAVRAKVSAPINPTAGLAGQSLSFGIPALGQGLAALSAPALSGSLSGLQAAPAVAAPLPVLPAPAMPAPAMPAAQVQVQSVLPALRDSAVLPAVAANDAGISAEPGRFSQGAVRVRASIASTLRQLFYQHAADAARAKEVEGIDPGWVEKMQEQDKKLPEKDKRRRKAVQQEGFTNAAFNRQVMARHNTEYTHEIPMGKATDQKMSGRCWIFSGLSMIRSVLLSEGKVDRKFEFSENYLHFFNMLEKAGRRFDNVLAVAARRAKGEKVPDKVLHETAGLDNEEDLSDGGYFEYFQFLVSKYGLAPKAAMKETDSSGNTDLLNKELSLALAAGADALLERTAGLGPRAAAKEAAKAKAETMKTVWKILSTHLGTPPASFRHAGTKYTPKDYAKSFAGFRPEDYVAIGSIPNQEEGAAYRVKRSAIGAARQGERRYDLRYLNVGIDRLEQLLIASLMAGEPVPVSVNAGTDMDEDTGIMHPDIYKRARSYGLSTREAKARASRRMASLLKVAGANHAMLFTGLDRPDPKAPVVKFKVENSWGRGNGDKGVYHMYREWLRENVFEIVVHKKFLTPAERRTYRGRAKAVKEKDIY